MEAAKQSRRIATGPFRAEHLPEEGSALVDPAGVVATLQKLTMSGSGVVRAAAKEHLSLVQAHMAENGGKIPAYAADDIKQGVGDTLRRMGSPEAPVTPKEVVRYAPVQESFVNSIHGQQTGYRGYLAAHASGSQPINDMQAARSILDPNFSGGWNAGGDQVARVSRIDQALRKDDRANFPMSSEARQ